MIHTLPELFEDQPLRAFSESVRRLGEVQSRAEVELAYAEGRAALQKVKDQKLRNISEERLLILKDLALKRIASAQS